MWERLKSQPHPHVARDGRTRLNEIVKDRDYIDSYNRVFADFNSYLSQTDTWTHRTQPELAQNPIAYFSMEFGLHETLPIYSADSACWLAII